MFKWMMAFILFAGSITLYADEPDHAIHEELRGLLKGLETTVNSGQYDRLHQYLHKDLHITMSNQEVLSSYEDVDRFFDFWFGPGGFLDHVEMKLVADDLTEFYADKTIGIVRGSGEENTYLSDSRFFPMKTRWTATVIKDDDGKWRILALHIGVNFLDNPILDVAQKSGSVMAVVGAAGGLIAGLFIGFMLWRRRFAGKTLQE